MSGRCIAMWSGPRNISTAMMRAWENRSDTRVIDEPFYVHYLQHTGIDHPMREEIIAAGEADWRKVVDRIVQPPAAGIFYQKHICTHWMDHFSDDWLDRLDNVFLIREPEPVIASYAQKRQVVAASDLGYARQLHLFRLLSQRLGTPPAVIDSRRFLADPAAQLQRLCNHLAIDFEQSMLHWPAGARATDGIWGRHWYDAVVRSTGFSAPTEQKTVLQEDHLALAEECRQAYEYLLRHAL